MAYKRALNSLVNGYIKSVKQESLQNIIDKIDKINEEYESLFDSIRSISKDTKLIAFDPEKYYSKYYKNTPVDDYIPLLKEPEKSVKKRIGFIKQNKLLEKINPSRTKVRLERNKEFQIEMDRVNSDYTKAERESRKKYDQYVKSIKEIDEKHNKVIRKRLENFYNNDSNEILVVYKDFYTHLVPDIDSMKYINFSYNNKKAILELEFIIPDEDFNRIKGIKYIKSKSEIKELYFTNSEFENLYENLVFNSMLSTVSKVWYYFKDNIDEFIVNAYVNKLNPSNGDNENYYFASVKLSKNDIPFDKLSLLDSKMFFDSKGARYKLPLINTKKIDVYEFSGKKMMDVIDDDIDGFDFENLTKELLEKNGFEKIVVTQSSGDYGADVIAYKDGIKYAIQCKKYSAKVGVKAVQEVIAAQSMYKCHVGVVLTNNYFTASAETLAESNGILLWDKDKLDELITNAGMDNNSDAIDEYDDYSDEIDDDDDDENYVMCSNCNILVDEDADICPNCGARFN